MNRSNNILSATIGIKLNFISLLAFMLLLAAGLTQGCAILAIPPPTAPVVTSLEPAKTGTISEIASQFSLAQGQEQSGFKIISNNRQAYLWRLALIEKAVQSIDIQYFIWQDDAAGSQLFDRLLKAADRGVRVRMLLDDFLFAPRDRDIAAITLHPHFDIKIYNPGRIRDSTLGMIGDYALNFRELNRRMHNKLFIVDTNISIVGGRNIGNEYFGLSRKYNFRDLDTLVVGPVVEEIASAFDKYWNADLAYPGSAMSEKATFKDMEKVRKNISTLMTDKADLLSEYRLSLHEFKQVVQQLSINFSTGEAHFIQDEPTFFHGKEHRLLDMLRLIAEPSQSELIFVTPYLIPVKGFLDDISEAASRGVKVKFLTGSMGANNHTIAHSHYKKYRRSILATGSELFEFRHDPSSSIRGDCDVPTVQAKFIAFHTKAIVVDKERCFVGSLNLDPRAITINTENELYIESAEFCSKLAEEFETMMAPENAWRIYLNEDNQLRWESSSGTVSIQPARSFWQRVSDFFFRLIPIESQL